MFNKIDKLVNEIEKFPTNMWKIDSKIKPTNNIGYYEKNIGYTFPEDYKYFISNYYGLTIPFETIYGTFEHEDIYNEYIFETEKVGNVMPKYLIPFSPNGRGDHYCFNKNNNKIYFWQHDLLEGKNNPDFECNTFTDWLEKTIISSLELI